MPTLALSIPPKSVSAAQVADENWTTNRIALEVTQPEVAALMNDIKLNGEWVFARDASVTLMTNDGLWWGNCSVPLLTGRALLKSLDAKKAGSCLLLPDNAGLVIAARERVGASIPLFVIQPDEQIARMILTCHDFSDDIRRRRLWIVSGSDWPSQFTKLFAAHSGLATPIQFIRTRLTPEPMAAPVVAAAERIFSEVVSQRAPRIAELAMQSNTVDSRNVLLIGSGEFRLWEFGSSALQQQLASQSHLNVRRFDTDEPMNGSPLALLSAAQKCGSVVAADISRADSNQPVSKEIPWIAWITQPNVPPFASAGSRDGLILADPNWRQLANQAGWPDHRVKICAWPVAEARGDILSPPRLAMIVDTQTTDVPALVKQFSSHRLLWELIDEELQANPFAVQSVDQYLTNRAGQLNVRVEALDRRTFIHRLILPAYQQGLARTLLKANIPLSLWGDGWMDLEAFNVHARGAIGNEKEFAAVVDHSAGLIYCWPERHAHPIDFTGKPVVFAGDDCVQFILNARGFLGGSWRKPPGPVGVKDALATAVMELIKVR